MCPFNKSAVDDTCTNCPDRKVCDKMSKVDELLSKGVEIVERMHDVVGDVDVDTTQMAILKLNADNVTKPMDERECNFLVDLMGVILARFANAAREPITDVVKTLLPMWEDMVQYGPDMKGDGGNNSNNLPN